MLVRREQPHDVNAICSLTTAAFRRTSDAAEPPETELVTRLRADEAWLPQLSLVAVADNVVIGHVACTRGFVDTTPALGLGPISVRPDHQGQGVGHALMHAVLGAADAADRACRRWHFDHRAAGVEGMRPARCSRSCFEPLPLRHVATVAIRPRDVARPETQWVATSRRLTGVASEQPSGRYTDHDRHDRDRAPPMLPKRGETMTALPSGPEHTHEHKQCPDRVSDAAHTRDSKSTSRPVKGCRDAPKSRHRRSHSPPRLRAVHERFGDKSSHPATTRSRDPCCPTQQPGRCGRRCCSGACKNPSNS